MSTQPPPEYAHLQAHSLIGHGRSVVYRALWLPADRLWMVGAEFRTPEEMAKTGWTYGAPVAADSPFPRLRLRHLRREPWNAVAGLFRPVTDAWTRICRTW